MRRTAKAVMWGLVAFIVFIGIVVTFEGLPDPWNGLFMLVTSLVVAAATFIFLTRRS